LAATKREIVNESTIAADRSGGTIIVQAQPMRNAGQLLAGPGTLRIIGLAGDLGAASISSGGHLDLSGTYTNNLALPSNGGTLTLNGDWFNAGELRITNSVLNLDGTFGLGDLGNIIRSRRLGPRDRIIERRRWHSQPRRHYGQLDDGRRTRSAN
jgi:hypothetical protein